MKRSYDFVLRELIFSDRIINCQLCEQCKKISKVFLNVFIEKFAMPSHCKPLTRKKLNAL